MATHTINKFGDILVEANSSRYLPDDLVIDADTNCKFKGFDEAPKGSVLLCESTKYGTLYATPTTKSNCPFIDRDTMMSGCGVVFIEQNEKKKKFD